MENIQRTKETELGLVVRKKKKGNFSCFEAGLWEIRVGKAVGGGLSGAQLRLWLPICLNLACGSTSPGKTQTCTNVAQAKYWKEKSLDILWKLQKIKAMNSKPMRLSWWRYCNLAKLIKEPSNTFSKEFVCLLWRHIYDPHKYQSTNVIIKLWFMGTYMGFSSHWGLQFDKTSSLCAWGIPVCPGNCGGLVAKMATADDSFTSFHVFRGQKSHALLNSW